jgi:serine/threonine protein kinase
VEVVVPAQAGTSQPTEFYERIVQVGEGTYGKVYKARNVETGALVALKRIRMEAEKDGFPVTAVREIKLLQNLRHRNVVDLTEMLVSKGELIVPLIVSAEIQPLIYARFVSQVTSTWLWSTWITILREFFITRPYRSLPLTSNLS